MTGPAQTSPTPEQMERASKIARRVLTDKVWKEARQRFINDATQADFEDHLVVVAGIHAALTAILQSDQQQAELVAALEPFAAMARVMEARAAMTFGRSVPDTEVVCESIGEMGFGILVMGHFRDALSLVPKPKGWGGMYYSKIREKGRSDG